MNDKKVLVELTRKELDMIVLGITSTQYPIQLHNDAFNLVLKLRDKQREAT
jgi:hypothetical protein